jgi:hypothetical protein
MDERYNIAWAAKSYCNELELALLTKAACCYANTSYPLNAKFAEQIV